MSFHRSFRKRSARARTASRLVLAIIVSLSSLGCGYRSVAGKRSQEQYCVKLASTRTSSEASYALLRGVVEGLLEVDAYREGTAWPCVEVEEIEASRGAAGLVSQGSNTPAARSVRYDVSARAWIRRTSGGEMERDTGDLSVADWSASRSGSTGLVETSLAEVDHERNAARDLGIALARSILGAPSGKLRPLQR